MSIQRIRSGLWEVPDGSDLDPDVAATWVAAVALRAGPGAVIVMRGLPAAGKSSWAALIRAAVRAGGDQALILSRDVLRGQLGVGWDATLEEERLVTRLQAQQAEVALGTQSPRARVIVIVDDCNLREGVVVRWRQLAVRRRVDCHVITVRADPDVCVARDAARPEWRPGMPLVGCRVGADVIRAMAAGGTTAVQDAIEASFVGTGGGV